MLTMSSLSLGPIFACFQSITDTWRKGVKREMHFLWALFNAGAIKQKFYINFPLSSCLQALWLCWLQERVLQVYWFQGDCSLISGAWYLGATCPRSAGQSHHPAAQGLRFMETDKLGSTALGHRADNKAGGSQSGVRTSITYYWS